MQLGLKIVEWVRRVAAGAGCNPPAGSDRSGWLRLQSAIP